MRTKTFEGFTINLTEKQFKALKKRFNPGNFNTNGYIGSFKSLVNSAECLCPTIRKGPLTNHITCEGCPFAFSNGRGQCGYLFVRWATTLGFEQPEYKVKLGVREITAEDDQGIAIVTAIYEALTSFRRAK